MLLLKNIVKNYIVGDNTIHALKGVDLEFRKSEFVSILGPSGCGKTTLLNIIGGLDRYTNGDLAVNGVSTKEFKDGDWDAYRNHSIGFVFQTYNLIPHQTVLANVELAMTLSGVSKAQRKQHAINVLTKVGLEDQVYKKPNQLSGGQMQRVAIARALVNDPEIILADEPTGALDTETSTQIMEILKEVAKDRLVVMVTHNPDIADKYSTRIIKLLDGSVLSDSNPYTENELEIESDKNKKENKKSKKAKTKKPAKTSMSFLTALALSLNNLMTKKTRTFLTAFAGSIGIIGIALILSLQNGVQLYIDKVEKDTLSSYPIIIQRTSVDMSAILGTSMGMHDSLENRDISNRDPEKIYSNDVMESVLNSMTASRSENDLANFKDFIENRNKNEEKSILSFADDVKYGYSTTMNIYKSDTSESVFRVSPSNLLRLLTGGSMGSGSIMSSMGGLEVWQELLDNQKVLDVQYDVIAGKMPEKYNEVVLIVDQFNEITDFTLYTLGLKDLQQLIEALGNQESEDDKVVVENQEQISFTYQEILDLTFKLVLNTDFYEKNGDIWEDKRDDAIFMKQIVDNAEDLKIVGILRPTENSSASTNGAGIIGYTKDLTTNLIDKINASQIVIDQKANPDTDIFTGKPFGSEKDNTGEEAQAVDYNMVYASLSPEQQEALSGYPEEQRNALLASYMEDTNSEATYEDNLSSLGVSERDNPSTINIYPANFAAKDEILKIIDAYNKEMSDSGQDAYVINYTDFVGLMMSSVSNVINTISMVLIAFVSIALIVSSIMIGIITYISVLERTKEIGILRSIGASKGDISRVFNAETLIVGFTSGALGIIAAALLCIPANIIIKALTDISNVAALPLIGGIALIIISMILTFIAGLVPSRIAAKKDPVVALRTE